MRIVWLCVIAAIFISAAPNRPTSQSATTMSAELQEAVRRKADANSAVAIAARNSVDRLHATTQYAALSKERDTRLAALEAARKEADTQARLAASQSFVQANEAVKQLAKQWLSSDGELARAQSAKIEAEKQLQQAQIAEQKRRAEKIVTKGMALADIVALWGKPLEESSLDDGTTRCLWREYVLVEVPAFLPGDGYSRAVEVSRDEAIGIAVRGNRVDKTPKLSRELMVWFKDGKAVQINDTKHDTKITHR